MVHFREKDRYDYGDLLEIIRILRLAGGLPLGSGADPRVHPPGASGGGL